MSERKLHVPQPGDILLLRYEVVEVKANGELSCIPEGARRGEVKERTIGWRSGKITKRKLRFGDTVRFSAEAGLTPRDEHYRIGSLVAFAPDTQKWVIRVPRIESEGHDLIERIVPEIWHNDLEYV